MDSLPLTRLVHDNLSVVMCFAYSRKALLDLRNSKFHGGWKYLDKALFDYSQERADKAFIELALFLRMIDDEWAISKYHTTTKNIPDCGKLVMKDGSEKKLTFREVSNKIIHSSQLEWELSNPPNLFFRCKSRDEEKWLFADIDLIAFAGVCGNLIS
jgi:hypothetical protein